jgi:hypothetical protein
VRVHLFVATLGYSRRVFVRAVRHERQSAWFDVKKPPFLTEDRTRVRVGAALGRASAHRPPRKAEAGCSAHGMARDAELFTEDFVIMAGDFVIMVRVSKKRL